MQIDLTYSNKEGISLQNILDVLQDTPKSKKDIQDALKTKKSIDTLLTKLENNALIQKIKVGNKVSYELITLPIIEDNSIETVDSSNPTPTVPKLIKAKPKNDKVPAAVAKINEQTASMNKEHQIQKLIEIVEEKKHVKTTERAPKTVEINETDLQALKNELAGRLGKEVTAILHKRKDKVVKTKKPTVQELYEEQKKLEEQDEIYETENPFRFVLNFFTSQINGEKATPYFRRRDDHAVKSIYNKIKTLCPKVDDYDIDAQNISFYRVLSINVEEKTIKMYHIDMNRIIRGIYTIFKIEPFQEHYFDFN